MGSRLKVTRDAGASDIEQYRVRHGLAHHGRQQESRRDKEGPTGWVESDEIQDAELMRSEWQGYIDPRG